MGNGCQQCYRCISLLGPLHQELWSQVGTQLVWQLRGRRNCPSEHLQERKEGRHLLSTFALMSTATVGPMGWNTLSVHQGHSKEQTPSPGVAFPPQTQVSGCWWRDAQQSRERRQEVRERAQCVPHTLFRPSTKLTPCAQPQPFCSPAWGIPQPVFLRKVLGPHTGLGEFSCCTQRPSRLIDTKSSMPCL